MGEPIDTGLDGCDANMTNAAEVAYLKTEFDRFLFAPIGEGRNGMLLSVVSMLARQNVDPWREAAALAELPKETAVRKLASLIAASSDELLVRQDFGVTAARLVALLPRSSRFDMSVREVSFGARSAGIPRNLLYVMVFVAAALGVQFLLAGRQTVAPAARTHAPTAEAAASQRPSPTVQ